jgi:hypothetical protein
VAGELGFEPRQTESESVVLPLHHSPKSHNNINALTAGCGGPRRLRKSIQAWRRSTSSIPGLASARGEAGVPPSRRLRDACRDKARWRLVCASRLSRELLDTRRRSRLHRRRGNLPIRKASGAVVAFGLTCPCKPDMQCCKPQKITEKAGQRRLKRVRPDAW